MRLKVCGSIVFVGVLSASWARAEKPARFAPPAPLEASPPGLMPTVPPLVAQPVELAPFAMPRLDVRAEMSSSGATYTRPPSKLGIAFVAGGLVTAVLGSVLIWKVTARPACEKGGCVWVPPTITAVGGAGVVIGVLVLVFEKPSPAVTVKGFPAPSVAVGPGGGSVRWRF